MLLEIIERLNAEFPTSVPYAAPMITYDKKERKLLLVLWVKNIRNDFIIDEHELDNLDNLISEIKRLA